MFGKKKRKFKKKQGLSVQINSIPDIFYGGQDPEVYHHSSQEPLKNGLSPEGVMIKSGKKTKMSKKVDKKITSLSPKKKWILGIVVSVIVLAGISFYYVYFEILKPNREIVVEVEENTTPIATVPDTSEIVLTSPTSSVDIEVITTTTTPEEIELATTTPALASNFLKFPQYSSLDTSDIDSDELTDIEEELFNTDSGSWDSDEDGYYDGQEVVNLYNPEGFSPVRLIDSGLVKEYINPYLGYRLYYPTSWQKGAVDPQESQVLFSSIFGDYVEVRAFDRVLQEDFVQWFGRNAEGQRFLDLVSINNRFKQEGWKRKDGLTAYFVGEDQIFVFVYNSKDRGPIAYRHVMEMMFQSFRIEKTDIGIPDQPIIVPSDVVTSTPVLENFITSTPTDLIELNTTSTDIIDNEL